MHRESTTTKNYPAQNVNIVMVEKPCFNWILPFTLIMDVRNPSQGYLTLPVTLSPLEISYDIVCCRYLKIFILIHCLEIEVRLH